jgi:hypothetical protein
MQLRLAKRVERLRQLKARFHKRLKSDETKKGVYHTCQARLTTPTLTISSSKNEHNKKDASMESACEHAFNVWSESKTPGVTMATTGCELTDAIFGAAHDANIVPEEFFQSLEEKEL